MNRYAVFTAALLALFCSATVAFAVAEPPDSRATARGKATPAPSADPPVVPAQAEKPAPAPAPAVGLWGWIAIGAGAVLTAGVVVGLFRGYFGGSNGRTG